MSVEALDRIGCTAHIYTHAHARKEPDTMGDTPLMRALYVSMYLCIMFVCVYVEGDATSVPILFDVSVSACPCQCL